MVYALWFTKNLFSCLYVNILKLAVNILKVADKKGVVCKGQQRHILKVLMLGINVAKVKTYKCDNVASFRMEGNDMKDSHLCNSQVFTSLEQKRLLIYVELVVRGLKVL